MKRHISIFAFLLSAFAAGGATAAGNQSVTAWGYWPPEPDSVYIEDTNWIEPDSGNTMFTDPLVFSAPLPTGWKVRHWRVKETYLFNPGDPDTEGTGLDGSLGKADLVWGYSKDYGNNVFLAVKYDYIKYNLKYDLAGGSGTAKGTNGVSYADEYALAAEPSKTGYTFRKWKASSNGSEFDAGATVSGKDLCLDTWHEDGHDVTMIAQWNVKAYDISTSGENCTVTVSKASGVQYTETVTIGWTPTVQEGHTRTFKSAKVLAGETELASFASGTSGTFTMSAANKGYFGNVTIRVVYEDKTNQYQVSVTSGGNGSVSRTPNQSKYDYGSTVTISATPNEGYAFASWSDGGAQTHDVTVGAADATYTATFTNRVYTLTWNANKGTFADGSSVSNVLIAYDSPLGDLPLPTRERMDRDGWYTEESGGNVVDSDTRYTWTYDRTLYMHWQESHLYKIKTVASPAEGGTTRGGGELATGETTTLVATPNDGYSFESWSDGGAQTHDVTVGLEDVTYTATFTGNTYKVYFMLEDTSGEEYDGDRPKSIERTYGDVYGELPPPTLDDETLEFVCWTDGDGNEITPETCVSSDDAADHRRQRIDLYVSVRRRLFYTVTFDGEGATSGSMDAQKIYRDEETALRGNDFRRTGHAFLGWAETNDLGRVKFFDGTNVLNIAKAGDTNELHAVWSANTYTVGFLPGGATETMEDQEFVYGQPQALRDCTFVRGDPELWSFAGWTNSAAGGPLYTNRETVVNLTAEPNGRVELTAVWNSTIGELSEAMGCDNLKWESATWKPGETSWTNDGEIVSCVMNEGNAYATMQTTSATTNGTLRFWWKSSGGKQGLTWRSNVKTEDCSLDEQDEVWRLFEFKGLSAPNSISIGHIGDGVCYIANMTWTPEGANPEPTDADKVTILSAAVSDGKFTLSFPSDVRFGYNLLTNANLLIDSWGVMTNEVGTGETITFNPEIIEGQPQLFYRVDTIQKK